MYYNDAKMEVFDNYMVLLGQITLKALNTLTMNVSEKD